MSAFTDLSALVTGRLWYRGRLIGSFEVPADEFADFAAVLEAGGTTVERTDDGSDKL